MHGFAVPRLLKEYREGKREEMVRVSCFKTQWGMASRLLPVRANTTVQRGRVKRSEVDDGATTASGRYGASDSREGGETLRTGMISMLVAADEDRKEQRGVKDRRRRKNRGSGALRRCLSALGDENSELGFSRFVLGSNARFCPVRGFGWGLSF